MKRKSFVLFLAVIALVAGFSLPVAAEYTEGDWRYMRSEGKVMITGYNNPNATTVTIPEYISAWQVTRISGGTFSSCHKLTEIIIPDSVTSIDGSAFSGCSSLTSIKVDANNPNYSTLNGVLFDKNQGTLIAYPRGGSSTYTIPSSVITIGNSAFSGCSSLTSITIPSSVITIGDSAFLDCSSLTSITIPDSVKTIGWTVFKNCSGLTSIKLSNSITRIENSTFWGCKSLTSIAIPYGVTVIDASAFYDCDSLNSIEIPNSVTGLGNSAFSDCDSLTTITIPASVTTVSYGAFRDCASLTSIEVDDGNNSYSSLDGVLFNKEEYSLEAYPQGRTATTYKIPDSVTWVRPWAFWKCTSLTSIEIPNVVRIQNDSFSNCSGLTSITIPDTVDKISSYAFSGCSNLQSIEIPASVKTIGSNVFDYCENLKTIYGDAGSTAESVASAYYIAFKIRVSSVSMEDESISLTAGATETLKATVAPANASNKDLTWSSSDPEVATVENGLVTAAAPGTATITATAHNGIAATCAVTVTPFIPVTGVTLNEEAISLNVGATETLIPEVAPDDASNKDLTWSSSDPEVATVDNDGKVTAVGAGDATITATAHNDIKAECTVTVAPIQVTGVTLNEEAISLNVGATETLTATVAPDNATNKAVTWTSDNTKAATVDNDGKVTGVAPGIAIITVTTADGGKTAVCKVKVTGPVEEFTDVASDAWFAPYVDDLVGLGIINGKGNGSFDPQGKITRAEFAKILATASGDDLTQYKDKTSFTDVATGQWFSESIEWAYQKGIVQGKGDGLYSPNDSISRQDMAVMIMRYAGYKIITLPETKPAVTFADDAEIGSWAKDAVAVMQKAGIIEGKGGNLFAPKDNATRAEAAKMISVFLNM